MQPNNRDPASGFAKMEPDPAVSPFIPAHLFQIQAPGAGSISGFRANLCEARLNGRHSLRSIKETQHN